VRWPAHTVALALTAAALTTLVCLGALRLAAPNLSGADLVPQVAILSLAAFFLPSACAGLVSPLLTVIVLQTAAPDSHDLSAALQELGLDQQIKPDARADQNRYDRHRRAKRQE